MVEANANIPHVYIEVKMSIITGKPTKFFYFTGDLGLS